MWHNDTGKRIFFTTDGRAVDEDDPKAIGLIVGVDGSIPLATAAEYGLTAGAKAKKDAPANKAKTPPDEGKKKA